MEFRFTPYVVVGILLLLVFFAAAAYVYWSDPTRPRNRWLALVLALDGIASQAAIIGPGFQDPAQSFAVGFSINWLASWANAGLYLPFAALALDTPLLRPFRDRRAHLALAGIVAAGIGAFFWFPDQRFSVWVPVALVFSIVVFTFTFVAAVDAYRRTSRHSLRRIQARAYLLAFGTRDATILMLLTVLALAIGGAIWIGFAHDARTIFWLSEPPFVLYFAFLAYGVMRTRMLDLDVRLRWTVRRGTLAGIFLAVYFVASELAINLFADATGSIVAGVLAAGLLVFALSPLQRFSERVAQAAFPAGTASATARVSDREAFYREHVEVAWEDGSIDRSDRALLNRLRQRLDLTAEQAGRIEVEFEEAAR